MNVQLLYMYIVYIHEASHTCTVHTCMSCMYVVCTCHVCILDTSMYSVQVKPKERNMYAYDVPVCHVCHVLYDCMKVHVHKYCVCSTSRSTRVVIFYIYSS